MAAMMVVVVMAVEERFVWVWDGWVRSGARERGRKRAGNSIKKDGGVFILAPTFLFSASLTFDLSFPDRCKNQRAEALQRNNRVQPSATNGPHVGPTG